MKKITADIVYAGVNDHRIDLFEGQYTVPHGMAYNSYVILDEKVAVFDTVDVGFTHEWMDELDEALNGRQPDYLIIQHMEPDHSANILNFIKAYPSAQIVGNAKTFGMMKQFFGTDFADNRLVVKDGDTLCTGKHTLTFVFAPMVHWPEVMVTYDSTDKLLFSADGFGKFGALDVDEPWDDEARRYYIGIVGKYGGQVQNLLKKAAMLDIQYICPLHGPVLHENLTHYLTLYQLWSSYEAETDGIFIAYTSVYGNTKKAVMQLKEKLQMLGCPEVVVMDLARCDMAKAVENAFRYGKTVFASTTYNAEVFPFMHTLITNLTERGFRNRTVGLIENGSWAPRAAQTMRQLLERSQQITYTDTTVTIRSTLDEESTAQLNQLAEELCRNYVAQSDGNSDKNDLSALFNIGYGMYVVSCRDGEKDNALIINAVTQVTNTPNRIAVTINKSNYSHHLIKNTGVMNVCFLSEDAPLRVIAAFGFSSGRNKDKFEGIDAVARSDNGLLFLTRYINSFISLKVTQYIDLGTHGMFIGEVTEARVLSEHPTMTYAFYQENVKPRADTEKKTGFICKVCGYIYEGEVLPDDFICPLCKHGAADFEPLS